MNKKSSYVNELYSERVKAISYFEKKIPNNFDLYGSNWNKTFNQSDRQNIYDKKIQEDANLNYAKS